MTQNGKLPPTIFDSHTDLERLVIWVASIAATHRDWYRLKQLFLASFSTEQRAIENGSPINERHTQMTTFGHTNGKLPDYLLYPDETGKYHLTDRFGHIIVSDKLNLSRDTLLSLLNEAGASYKEITFKTPPPVVAER